MTIELECIYSTARAAGQSGIKTPCPEFLDTEWRKIPIKGTDWEQHWRDGYALGRNEYTENKKND